MSETSDLGPGFDTHYHLSSRRKLDRTSIPEGVILKTWNGERCFVRYAPLT